MLPNSTWQLAVPAVADEFVSAANAVALVAVDFSIGMHNKVLSALG